MIATTGLTKRFGRLTVLDGLDLCFQPGHVTAVVGPNGSGKTTLIKCILGMCRPDSGAISIDGQRTGERPDYRKRIGYMPQFPPFPENLTPREILALLKNLRGVEQVDESLLEAFRLTSEMDKPIRVLSGGNRQKVSAVAAFLFDPDLLILDEPTAGLDPLAGSLLKDRIRAARDHGKTILLTSHIMSEIEELADDLVFLLEGRIAYGGTVSGLQHAAGSHTLERAIAGLMSGPRTLLSVAA